MHFFLEYYVTWPNITGVVKILLYGLPGVFVCVCVYVCVCM